MYRSLYQNIKPLIFDGKSGILYISYEYGDSAKIMLNEGLVEGVLTEKLEGKPATEAIAKWVSFSTRFSQDEKEPRENLFTIDTNRFLSLFEKVHKIVQKINTVIPSNNAIFTGDTRKVDKHRQFSTIDLKTLLLLDGKRSLKKVISESGYPELDVMISIYRLVSSGAARFLTDSVPMPDEEREAFINTLSSKLTDFMGPAATIVLDDAFQLLGHGAEMLSREEIPKIIETIGESLENKEKEALVKWGSGFIEKISDS